jgi:hypothetical protein
MSRLLRPRNGEPITVLGPMKMNRLSIYGSVSSPAEDDQDISKVNRSRRFALLTSLLIVCVVIIWGLNRVFINGPLQRVVQNDPRNHSVQATAHWRWWVDPNVVIFDIQGLTGSASRIDVFRVFSQFAEAMKDRRYSRVILASQGQSKFILDGMYFQELGNQYSTEKPMYIMREFPTWVSTASGNHPFHEPNGGLLVMLADTVQQFTELSNEWYWNDLTSRASAKPTGGVASQTNFDPCAGLSETDPHCGWKPHWEDSGVSINQIDGTKTEFINMESVDADSLDYGDVHFAMLKLCFDNGRLCGGQAVAIGIRVHEMLASANYQEEYSTPVRIRFDDDSPTRQTWGISDDHEVLFPYGLEKQFGQELLAHNKLIVEFSYYEKAPRTVMFDLTGLDNAMRRSGLSF